MGKSKVFQFDGGDPEMQRAFERARATFRYFWREMAWEMRRIIPALELACVKASFSDGDQASAAEGAPQAEQMWIDEVDFDGQFVSGVLLNEPNWLTSVQAGDSVRLPLGEISDWMYVIDGEVYGAFTVNLMRSRMDPQQRQEHDSAWGLEFGDPKTIRIVPQDYGEDQEHPMSEAMVPSLREQLAKDPSLLHGKDDRGWTILHQEALAGSAPTVKVLLECGADRSAVTDHGLTPKQLAMSLGWNKVATLL